MHTNPIARALPACLALLASVLAALAVAGNASATTPCAKAVINDWYADGRIDRLYPLHCYREAIKALPPDIRLYADAQDVISRAMQMAVRGKTGASGPDPTPGGSRGIGGGSPQDGNGNGNGNTQASGTTGSSASAVPVPLLVLGGMALALLAAGGLGYVARRRAAEGEDSETPDDDQQL